MRRPRMGAPTTTLFLGVSTCLSGFAFLVFGGVIWKTLCARVPSFPPPLWSVPKSGGAEGPLPHCWVRFPCFCMDFLPGKWRCLLQSIARAATAPFSVSLFGIWRFLCRCVFCGGTRNERNGREEDVHDPNEFGFSPDQLSGRKPQSLRNMPRRFSGVGLWFRFRFSFGPPAGNLDSWCEHPVMVASEIGRLPQPLPSTVPIMQRDLLW